MNSIFYLTDVHGQYSLFNTMIKWCKNQNPNCTIIFGGDAADRGPDGYHIIKELLNDPQIIYLYGNHEDLFIRAADEIIGKYAMNDELYEYLHHCDEARAKKILQETFTDNVRLHLQNGGEPTLIAWLCDSANEDIIDKLRDLPRTFSYENIDFCHAGASYNNFKNVANAEYKQTMLPAYDEEMVIWDRNCIPLGWETGRICIHGHTPTIYLPAKVYGQDKSKGKAHPCAWHELLSARDKRGGLKIDMDTGMTFTGRGFVLNCLTLKAIGFLDPAICIPDMPHSVTLIEEYDMREKENE